MKKSIVTVALVAAFASSAAMAGLSATVPATATTTAGSNAKTETKAYVGLNWSLGGGMTPALVLGAFNTKVKSNGDTTGANLAFHVNLVGGIKPGKLKLGYLNGERNDLQGEVGVGYDFGKSAPLLGLGVNAPYVAAGIDGYLDMKLSPYATLHSQGKFDKPNGRRTTTYSCPDGYELSGTDCNQLAF